MNQKITIGGISPKKLENYLETILDQEKNGVSVDQNPKLKFVNDAISRAKSLNCPTHNEITMQLNDLMQTIMGMDFVKQMLVDVQNQKQMIESISAAGEENAASIEQVSELVQESAKFAQETTEIAHKGMEISELTLEHIHEAYDEIISAHKAIEDLTHQADEIDSLINLISSIANQTNLLALNASIEAARSGEAGKGFAVVAAEIKKLANSTAESASYIEKKLNVMNKGIVDSSNSISMIAEKFYGCRDNIDTLASNVTKIGTSVDGISVNMQHIMSSIEEQTCAEETISSSLANINEKTIGLYDDCIKTGKAFYDISMKINGYRSKTVDMLDNMSAKEAINFCIIDHLNWKWRIYNMLLGYDILSEEEVGNHNTCRLGKWLKSYSTKNQSVSNYINILEDPHSKLHRVAVSAIKAYKAGDIASADKFLNEIDSLSKEIVSILEKMLNNIS